MPDSFKYRLDLDPKPFVEGAKTAEAADKQLTQTITSGAKESAKALQEPTAAIRDLGEAARPAGEAAKTASGGLEKMGKDIGSLKDIGRGMAIGALTEGVQMLGSALKETHPNAAKALSALSNIGSAAAAGAMVAGPAGATIAGALTAVAEGYKALTDNSEANAEQDRVSKKATEDLNAALERKAERLKDAAEAGREAAKALTSLSWLTGENNRKLSEELNLRRQLERFGASVDKIKAGSMEGKQGVEAIRAIEKREVKQQFDGREEELRNDYNQAQNEAVRINKRREAAAAEIKTLKPGQDERRAELRAEIDNSTQALDSLTKEAATAREKLKDFKANRPKLEEASNRAIDAKADAGVNRENAKSEDEAFKKHAEARRKQLDDPNHPDNIAAAKREKMAKLKEEAESRGIDVTKNGWARQLGTSIVRPPASRAMGDAEDDDDEDSPRRGRAAGRARIQGGIAAGSYQRDRMGNKFAMGKRGSDDTKDPRIANRGRAQGEVTMTKAEQATLKLLSDMYRELRKQNSPKK